MLGAVLVSLRPRQWVKNLFVFAGLVFGQRLFTPAVWPALGAFAIFCGLSGAIYLVNDVADREKDRLHPKKRERPIAAGRLPVRVALGVAAALVAAGLVAAARISAGFLLVAVAYVVLLTAYSAWLKHVVIVDVLTVALGFVLRALGGTLAIDVAVSGWLLICTILSALFLALGKRRNEYLTLEADAARHRPILAEYSAGLLDQMIAVVTASTVTPTRSTRCRRRRWPSSTRSSCRSRCRSSCTGSSATSICCTAASSAATRRSCSSATARC